MAITGPYQTTFAECNAVDGFYFYPAENLTCEDAECPFAGQTGCCCACKNLTPQQRALLDADILGSTFGMVDGVGQCDCEDAGGKWVRGPCDRTRPIEYCRKPNGVDVRLPKACCGVTLISQINEEGLIQYVPAAYCEDVCSSKECSENVILNYVATYYNNGRRCFFANNAGAPVASYDCRLIFGEGNDLISPPSYSNSIYPVCNNSNFMCWGNNCGQYVNLINNGFFTSPTINDYNVTQSSGGVSKLSDFNDIDEDKNVIGTGLFVPFTKNYLQIKAKYGRAAFITQDNKVIFTGSPLTGIQNGIEYSPQNYTSAPFNKYDRVEIGKNFAILKKPSNIGTKADFVGYLTPGNSLTVQDLTPSGVLSVHALEEAACVTRLNFLTNNVELLCKGYPFSTQIMEKVDGGQFDAAGITYHYTIDPDTVSCHGFHCTYQRYKLDENRVFLFKEWIRKGEYKRSKDQYGNNYEIPDGRVSTFFNKNAFQDGVVVAGYNFDCFMEGVTVDASSDDGYLKLSCYGIWDPDDSNKQIANIVNHEFGIKARIPDKEGFNIDCDYEKCFATVPIQNYCVNDTELGNCCIPGETCNCLPNVNRSTCSAQNGFFSTTYSCADCLADCEVDNGNGSNGDSDEENCMSDAITERGACCRTIQCGDKLQYECVCRTKQLCQTLGGQFSKNFNVTEVPCGQNDVSGNCCFRGGRPGGAPGSATCITGWTNQECFTCIRVDENNECISYSNAGYNGSSYFYNNKWSQDVCCLC
jgi:hypothetical protein